MPRSVTTMFVLLALPATALATAQPARNAAEARSDHRQIAVDRAQGGRDALELSEFEQTVATLRDAFEDRMTGRYREINARLQAAMTREVEQARVKLAQAGNETRKSRWEAHGERMEAGMTGNPRDVAQTVDDRHDVNDDRRDRRAIVVRGDEMARIGSLSGALQNEIERGDRTAMARNVELASQFLALLRADAAANTAEWSEDHRELREDRRERRTDRR